MIEEIKLLQPSDIISIDSQEVKSLLESEDFVIDSIHNYDIEEGEIVIAHTDSYALVCFKIIETERYFFYETYNEGYGKNRYYKKETFVTSFKIDDTKYTISDDRNFITEDEETVFCQFDSTAYYNSSMIKVNNKNWILYRGFEIEESQIII